jgi:hypothetical protein
MMLVVVAWGRKICSKSRKIKRPVRCTQSDPRPFWSSFANFANRQNLVLRLVSDLLPVTTMTDCLGYTVFFGVVLQIVHSTMSEDSFRASAVCGDGALSWFVVGLAPKKYCGFLVSPLAVKRLF